MGAIDQRFFLTELPLCGLQLLQRKRIGDSRGYLERLFCEREFRLAGWHKPIRQINITFTAKQGTIRGMHYQAPPHAESKVVMCLKGRVFDVAVDLRKESPSFLKHHAEILAPEESNALVIPEGFAHGFQTLTPEVEILYFHSAFYAPESEGGIHPKDPLIHIDWPIEISEMSARDRSHAYLSRDFQGLSI